MGKLIELEFNDGISMRDNLTIGQKRKGFKKSAVELIQGWFPNIVTKDGKYGVHKVRIIDKLNNFYKEYVRDLKTGRIIRYIEEKLTDHRK